MVGLIGAGLLLVVSAEAMPSWQALAWAALAGLLGVTGLAALYQALASGLMTLVSPIAAAIAAGLPAAVGLLLGERLAPAQLAGLLLALAAVVIVSLPRGRARLSRGQLLLALAAGLGFAGFYLGTDQASLAGGQPWWTVVSVRAASTVLLLAGAALFLARGRPLGVRAPFAALAILFVTGLGDLGGNLFVILALQVASLSVTAVVSSLYPVVTIVLAAAVLGERLGRLQVSGVVLALAGIVLIAL